MTLIFRFDLIPISGFSMTPQQRDFHPRIVEAGAAAKVCQRIGDERIGRQAIVVLLRRPLASDTVPRRMSGVRATGQCTSPRSLKMRTGSSGDKPLIAASSGCICRTPAQAQLAKRGRHGLLAGEEINASG